MKPTRFIGQNPSKDKLYITRELESDNFVTLYWHDYSEYWRSENYFHRDQTRQWVDGSSRFKTWFKKHSWIEDDNVLNIIFQEARINALRKIFNDETKRHWKEMKLKG